MFIAINAKADISDSKKGKLTPAQNAQLNAWCLATKTGILDCLDRCEATSPSYSAVNNEATIVFHKGYVVICGRLIECEEGSSLTVTTPLTDSETGWIVLRYDLSSSGENEFKIVQKKTTDGALIQQDLNDNPLTAVFEFPLYSYTATPNTISLSRNVEYVPDIGNKLQDFITILTGEGKPLYQYDESQGTIESRLETIDTRLTNLGFREGSISGTNISNATLTRQGNYVIGKFDVSGNFSFTLPADFRPKVNTQSSVGTYYYDTPGRVYRGSGGVIYFNVDGSVTCTMYGDRQSGQIATVCFGFEANPIS